MNKKRIINSFVSMLVLISLAFSNYSPSYAAADNLPDASQNHPSAKKPSFVPGVILVGFKSGVTVQESSSVGTVGANSARTLTTNSTRLGITLRSLKAQSIQRISPDDKSKTQKFSASVKAAESYRLRLPANADVLAAVQALSADFWRRFR